MRIFSGLMILTAIFLANGCSRHQPSAQHKRLQARQAELEKENRGLQAQLNRFRKLAVEVEADRAQLEGQLEQLRISADERDALREKIIVQRTSERDTLQTELDRINQELQSFVGRLQSNHNIHKTVSHSREVN